MGEDSGVGGAEEEGGEETSAVVVEEEAEVEGTTDEPEAYVSRTQPKPMRIATKAPQYFSNQRRPGRILSPGLPKEVAILCLDAIQTCAV